MTRSPLNKKDLNLLKVLEALYLEGSVSKAAGKLYLTQSAVSHSLKKLRENFDDEMFVRSSDGMSPTAFTQSIMPEVSMILGASKRLFDQRRVFDPATSDRLFKIGMPEYVAFALLENLFANLEKDAPHVKIMTVNLTRHDWEDAIEGGRVDLVVGRFDIPAKNCNYEDLFTDKFVCISGAKAKWIKGGNISLQDYLSASHLNTSINGNFQSRRIDRELEKQGEKRNIRMTVSSYGPAFHIVKDSDMLLTEQERIATPLAKTLGLKIAELPFESPVYTTRQVWHRQYDNDAGHLWLRGCLRDAAKRV